MGMGWKWELSAWEWELRRGNGKKTAHCKHLQSVLVLAFLNSLNALQFFNFVASCAGLN